MVTLETVKRAAVEELICLYACLQWLQCSAFSLCYPGGKGPLLIGVILGVVVATAAEAEVPGLGPLADCEEPAVAAPAPESSC